MQPRRVLAGATALSLGLGWLAGALHARQAPTAPTEPERASTTPAEPRRTNEVARGDAAQMQRGARVAVERAGLLLVRASGEGEPPRPRLLVSGAFGDEAARADFSDWWRADEAWWSWAPVEAGEYAVRVPRADGDADQSDAQFEIVLDTSASGASARTLLETIAALREHVRSDPAGERGEDLMSRIEHARGALTSLGALQPDEASTGIVEAAMRGCDPVLAEVDAIFDGEASGLEQMLSLARARREQAARWLGETSAVWMNAIYWEGGLLERLHQLREASEVFERGRVRAAEVWGEADPDTVRFALRRAECLGGAGLSGEAFVVTLRQARLLQVAERPSPELAIRAVHLAVLLGREETRALDELLELSTWAREVLFAEGRASVGLASMDAAIRHSLAGYLFDAGRVPEGLEQLSEARRMLLMAYPAGSTPLLQSLHTLAGSLLLVGRAEQAWEQVGGLLEGVREMAPLNPWPASYCLSVRGRVLMELRRFDEAADAFSEALALLPEDDRAWTQHRGVLLGSVGAARAATGDTQGAIEALRRAEATFPQSLRPTHPDRLRIRQSIAEVLFAQGAYAQSAGELAVLLESYRAEVGDQHPRIAEVGGALAHAALLSGDRELSRRAALAGLAAADAQRRADSAIMSDIEAARRFAGAEDLSGVLLSLAVQGVATGEEALEAVLRRQGVVLDSIAARAAAAQALRDDVARGGDAVSRVWDELAIARARLSAAFRGPDTLVAPEGQTTALQRAWRDVEDAERRLSEASPGFALLARAEDVDPDDVRGALREGDALICYVHYAPIAPQEPHGLVLDSDALRVCAITLTARGGVRVVDLGPAQTVRELVEQFLRSVEVVRKRSPELQPLSRSARVARRDAQTLARFERETASLLHDLSAILWHRLPEDVRSASRAYVAPSGVLHRLPFGALVPVMPAEGAPPRYLIEEGPQFVMLAGPRQLVRASIATRAIESAAAPWRGLVLGPPAFDPETGLVPLDGFDATTAANASRLGEVLGPERVRRLHGEHATERALREAAADAAILEVFTHGLLDPGGSEPGAGMLRSRLMFASAAPVDAPSDPQDDGVVTGAEVLQLDLRDARVVLLTACHSGEGAIASDGLGLEGLRAAFIAAGAASTVGNLWEVPAHQAAYLTSEFYREWLDAEDRTDAATAHHRAQLGTLRLVRSRDPIRGWETGHPYFWAFASFGGAPMTAPPKPVAP